MRRLLPILIAALCFAQDETPLFKTGVSLVKVDVEVQDAKGVGVSGLRSGDFIVYDEGQREAIADFAAESQPVRILILLDVSPSMSKYLADLGAKSTEALAFAAPRGRGSAYGFRGSISADPALDR